jgi:abortive infection bacteriophage resistance protein
MWGCVLRFSKPATTIEHQAQLLIDRGLVVKDRIRLERELRTIGYYRLSSYWLPFEQKALTPKTQSKVFKQGTRHEDVIECYIFDRKLRLIVMEAIERLEVAARASWTNRLALAHGPHAYCDPANFRDGRAHRDCLNRLKQSVDRSNDLFVKHYRDRYSDPPMPPLWIVTEIMTLGELSKWYGLTRSVDVRAQVAVDLGIASTNDMESIFQSLSFVRNICAHHGRLWNRRMTKRLPNCREIGDELMMDRKHPKTPQNSIYNFIIACLHMLSQQSPSTTYAQRLACLLRNESTNRQRASMGFPINWESRRIWGL